MPRYRFSWAAVPQPLLRRLARELCLDGDAAGALEEAYGKRPRETFVRDPWPTLRDQWLARDTATRREIVAALRERGLGDVSLPVRNREQQQTYLATCRNAAALRTVVLEAFRSLGEPAEGPVVRSGGVGRRATRPSDINRGLWSLGEAWCEFEDVWIAALESWTGGTMLLRLPELHRPGGFWVGPVLCVTDEGDGQPGLALVSGTPFALPPMLGPEQDTGLRRFGWEPAPADPDDIEAGEAYPDAEWCYRVPVHRYADGSIDHARTVNLVIQTCTEVFGVLHPYFLEPDGFWGEKYLGIERVENGPAAELSPEGYLCPPEDRVVVFDINDTEHLQELVDTAIAQRLGAPADHDQDGDIPIVVEGFSAYVRVAPDAPMVTAFCWMLTAVPASGKVFRRLNQINGRYRVGKLTWVHGAILVSVDVLCAPFAPALVRSAVDGLAAVLSEADAIHDRLGGDRCDGRA